jgi:hypothetical protein
MLRLRPRGSLHRGAVTPRSVLAAVCDRRLGECCLVRTPGTPPLSSIFSITKPIEVVLPWAIILGQGLIPETLGRRAQ